jgi:hypothetical protein
MTWSKRGQEFSDECAMAGLTDAAYRTHSEAIDWLYRIEELSLLIPKRMLPRFAGSDSVGDAVEQLVGLGFWRTCGSSWEIVHHGDVIRQSIVAQQDKRGRDKRAQAAARERRARAGKAGNVSADVSAESAPTQSVSQGLRTGGSRQGRTSSEFARRAGAGGDGAGGFGGIAKPPEDASHGQPEAPSPKTGDGSNTVVHDDQQIPVNGSAGASHQTVTRARGGRPPLPEPTKQMILSLSAQGVLNQAQIARQAGVAKSTVHKVLHQVAS